MKEFILGVKFIIYSIFSQAAIIQIFPALLFYEDNQWWVLLLSIILCVSACATQSMCQKYFFDKGLFGDDEHEKSDIAYYVKTGRTRQQEIEDYIDKIKK